MKAQTDQSLPFNQYCQDLRKLIKSMEVSGPDNLQMSTAAGFEQVKKLLSECAANKNKVFVLGNGGSAAIAAHIQNDLCNGAGIRALSCQDIPTLTALSNDHGYTSAYERLIEQWAASDDLMIAISSSGESENIIRAVASASAAGCRIVTISGFNSGNKLRQLGVVNFYVPSKHYGHVETIHAIIGHFLTDTAQS